MQRMVPQPVRLGHDLAGLCEAGAPACTRGLTRPGSSGRRATRSPQPHLKANQAPLLLTLTAAFAVLTAAIVAHTGLLGFYRQLLDAPAAWQTRVDITIALGLALTWMWRDARRTGRACWPWVPVTLLLGSVGPLL